MQAHREEDRWGIRHALGVYHPGVMTLLLLMLSAALAAPHEAEVGRLDAEMTRLAQKELWAGVDRKYRQLLELKRAVIPPRLHLLGAQAAHALHDVGNTYLRAERAIAGDVTDMAIIEDASRWMAEVRAHYGPVSIELSVAYPDEVDLIALDGAGFTPRVRNATTFVREELQRERRYTGFLPLGRYRIGDTVLEIYGEDVNYFVRFPKNAARTAPEPEAAPSVEAPPDRTVSLAVRGGGWQADRWDDHVQQVRSALYGVDGVLEVEAIQPEAPWIVVLPDLDNLATYDLTPAEVGGALRTGLDITRMVETDTYIAFPPGTTDVQAVAKTVVKTLPIGDTPQLIQVVDVATIRRPLTGPYPVPPNVSGEAGFRFEVKLKGGSDALDGLVPAVSDGPLTPLGLTLEAPEAP